MSKEQIIAALVNTGEWGELQAAMGIENHFKCQYCGKDLLESVDSYKEWQTDHLIPVSAGGSDIEDNYVLSCRTCNFIKSRWDPRSEFPESNPTKKQLIAAAKQYIIIKRQKTEASIQQIKTIIGCV